MMLYQHAACVLHALYPTACMQDLLARIFTANPAERITLSQIKHHPWFLKNLPIELAVCSIHPLQPTPTRYRWLLLV